MMSEDQPGHIVPYIVIDDILAFDHAVSMCVYLVQYANLEMSSEMNWSSN